MDLFAEITQSQLLIEQRPELFNSLVQALYSKLPVKSLPEHVLANTSEYVLDDDIEISISLIRHNETDEPSSDILEVEITEKIEDASVANSVINRSRFITINPQIYEATYREWCDRDLYDESEVEEISDTGEGEGLYSGQAIEVLMLLERLPDYN